MNELVGLFVKRERLYGVFADSAWQLPHVISYVHKQWQETEAALKREHGKEGIEVTLKLLVGNVQGWLGNLQGPNERLIRLHRGILINVKLPVHHQSCWNSYSICVTYKEERSAEHTTPIAWWDGLPLAQACLGSALIDNRWPSRVIRVFAKRGIEQNTSKYRAETNRPLSTVSIWILFFFRGGHLIFMVNHRFPVSGRAFEECGSCLAA